MRNEKNSITADNRFSPKLRSMDNSKIRVELKWSRLKQHKVTLVNLFIVYELDTWPKDLNSDFTLKYFLFRTV